ncbi:type-F conjugative transfer system protein TrbI [Serratia liquefaciens]|uniref:type-F conjugative transfer system protein TrbI n=1 Tax=Serratia liquefaciens TaxID=614 RepID=UPI0032DE8E30
MGNEMTPVEKIQPEISNEKKRSHRRKRCVRQVLIAGLIVIGLNAGISMLLNQWQQPVTVSFDMKATIDTFMDSVAKKQLTEQQSAVLAERFNHALSNSLGDYQRKHQALILATPAVVSTTTDITREIQADIAKRMRGE